MRIISYKACGETKDQLSFSEIHFKKLNLVVGDSATGKSRLLNTIFNGARLVVRKEAFYIGSWDMILEHDGKTYHWKLETKKFEGEEEGRVIKEHLSIIEDNKKTNLVERTPDFFIYKNDEMPKLSTKESSIALLQDEDLIKPLYQGLTLIMRRNFSGPDLRNEASYQNVPQKFLKKIKKTKNLYDLFSSNLNLSCRLYILSKVFNDLYQKVCKEFRAVFPFVTEVEILEADKFGFHFSGIVPVFSMKEKFSKEWIQLNEFSAGMLKVLLILTDIFILPQEGAVYLIDEYENSLGVSAINFFPNVLFESETPSQFIITSHHPYIIGNVPIKNWIILHRKGNTVLSKQGEEIEKRFSKSKQKAFIQLINDPFYAEGVE
jgi:predicted ATPase